MKKVVIGIAVILVGIAIWYGLFSTKDPGPAREIKVNNEFALTVPGFMNSTDRLAGNAPFQYQSRYRTVYAVAMGDDRKSDFQTLSSYTQKVLKGFTDQLKEPKVALLEKKEHNGYPAQVYEIRGTHSGEEIHYYLMTIQVDNRFYQACAWTLASKDDQYGGTIEDIVNSFNLL